MSGEPKVEVLLPNVTKTTGEGPHWEEGTGRLLFVDILAGDVHRWNSATNEHEKIHFDGPATFIIPRSSGGYVVGVGRKILSLDWETKATSTLAEIELRGTNNRLNDAKCDSVGRLWAGTMGAEPTPAVVEPAMGILGCLDTKGVWHQHLENIDLSNGMAWSKDAKTMFFIDSIPRAVYALDYDVNAGSVSNQRVMFDLGQEVYPDGCCIDSDDNLWVACYSGSKVIQIDTKTGQKIREVALPTQSITSCCFGGPNYEDLYVTSGRRGVPDEALRTTQAIAGSIFKITNLGVRGLPGNIFRG